MSAIPLLFLIALAQAAPGQITVGEAKASAAPVLAARLLPADVAPRIVGGRVARQWLPGQVYRASFWEKAEPISKTLCRRRFHGVQLSNPTAPGHPDDPAIQLVIGEHSTGTGYRPTYPHRATAKRCSGDKGWITPPADRVEAMLAAVEQLTAAMRSAAKSKRLPFAITCREDEGGNACADRRTALASLPLDELFHVSFETGHKADQVYPGSNGGTAMQFRQAVPAPEGRHPTPTFEFGNSGNDGRSWRVTLVGPPGRLTEVQMRRSLIFYH